VHAPWSHTWSGLQAWATGAPIIADTANSVPTAAKSEVMVRDVERISRLFTLLESGHEVPPALLVAFRQAAGHLIIGCELAQSVKYRTTSISRTEPANCGRSARHRSGSDVGDAHRRRPFQACAVRVERRPVHRLVACATGPGGVAAAVSEAGLMPDEDLPGAERVAVRAAARRVGDPLPGRRLHQLA
jgi:hypothetical protein